MLPWLVIQTEKQLRKVRFRNPASEHGDTLEKIFYYSSKVKEEFGEVTPGALGMYSYYEKNGHGSSTVNGRIKAILVSMKFTRDDIFALTREAADITGINYIMDWGK